MSEINLKTWKRAKVLTAGFKDFAERVTEELLEPRDKHSFIVQYIISFSVYIKAQRDCCALRQRCFPVPWKEGRFDWSCLCALCSQRPDLAGTECPGPSAPVPALGLESTPCSAVCSEHLSDSEGWAFSCLSAGCQVNSTMSAAFGVVVSSSFQPVAVQYPRQRSPLC